MKRKATDTVQLSKIRMREELRRKLAKDAERNAVTLNGEIVDRLEASYRDDERIKELQQRLDEAIAVSDRLKAMQQTLNEIAGKIFVDRPLGPTGQIASQPNLIATGIRNDEEGNQ